MKRIFFFCFLIVFFPLVYSNENISHENEELTSSENYEEQEKFDPGHFILHHIGDAYEWHIIGEVAIPLPVIVYSKGKGFNVFSSSRLAHGKSYNGFKIEEHGENSGKLVEVISEHESRLPLLDISLTKNVLAIMISMGLMLFVFISIANSYKNRKNKAPKGLQSAFEPLILFIRDEVAKPAIGEKKYEKFMPYLLSVFFFIWLNNMLGLLPTFPGGANTTGNIAVTLALALCTFLITTFRGNKNYWKHIFNTPGVPWWLKVPLPLMPFIEFVGIFIKPFVLMVRLFANISAGHIIALGFYSLIFVFGAMQWWYGLAESPLTIAFTIFMFMLELLVAFIQAYVFTLLSAIYFGMATEEHH